ncbi:MAG: cofactor-independent phosphoglycerate mutase [Promethearchaeota archaeon]|nr:MAG: cofactor-independent phosphoglycerate mutase [Candidatus Lokiarchaeota archaeon]
MKYVILVCDGAADWPIESLGNKTIFEAADIPYMDYIASHGKMGALRTIPEGNHPGSEVANMSIMGYRPEKDLTGRGPLEALSANVPLNETDIAFRCNLITIENELIKDYSAGHITTKESKQLILKLQSQLNDRGVDFFPGVQYRHILRLDGKIFSEDIILTPPHDQLDKPYKDFLARTISSEDEKAQMTANYINELIERSHEHLIKHPINKKRNKKGKSMATHIWPWGGGKKPIIEPFQEKYGLDGAVISAVDLIHGLGIAAGLEPIHVKGATGLPNTNYKGKVKAGLKILKKRDFLYLHVEATDEMAHTGDPHKKIDALEKFDQLIVKPILEAENKFNNNLSIAILPDHPTPCEIRTHSNEPVPFAIYNPLISTYLPRKFSEMEAQGGEFGLIENGEEFIRLLLQSQ